MTFGEKLQFLRKQMGMSQEQLASKLMVSRQAISKWELDHSFPDIENVVQLSKVFHVTTDYLVNDEIAEIEGNPVSKDRSIIADSRAELNTGSVLGLIIMVVGGMISFVGFRTYQAEIPVVVGICIQLSGILLFEIWKNKSRDTKPLVERKIFYTASFWLMLPPAALFLSQTVLHHRKPLAHWTFIIIPALVYFLVCITITIILWYREILSKVKDGNGEKRI